MSTTMQWSRSRLANAQQSGDLQATPHWVLTDQYCWRCTGSLPAFGTHTVPDKGLNNQQKPQQKNMQDKGQMQQLPTLDVENNA